MLGCVSLIGSASADTLLNSVIFASADSARSVFIAGGFKRGLSGPVSATGFTALVSTGSGEDNKRDTFSPTGKRLTRTSEIQAMLGYQYLGDDGAGWSIHLGVRAQQREEMPVRNVIDEKLKFGPAILVDLWARPFERIRMDATLAASTVRSALWARLAMGYVLPTMEIVLGAEAIGFSDVGSSDAKVGVYLAQIPVGRVRLRAAAGWAMREVDKDGLYVSLGGYAPL